MKKSLLSFKIKPAFIHDLKENGGKRCRQVSNRINVWLGSQVCETRAQL